MNKVLYFLLVWLVWLSRGQVRRLILLLLDLTEERVLVLPLSVQFKFLFVLLSDLVCCLVRRCDTEL